MYAVNPEDELQRLFRGMVEQTFIAEVGICAPELTDYVADMLLDFLHVDQIYRMRDVDGAVIRDISRLQAEAHLGHTVPPAVRERLINRYIGDFALFWTGLYPETLRARRHFGVDRLREYVLQGQRGYEIASGLSDHDDQPPPTLLHELSTHFETCVWGLHLVRADWDRLCRGPREN